MQLVSRDANLAVMLQLLALAPGETIVVATLLGSVLGACNCTCSTDEARQALGHMANRLLYANTSA